MVDVDVDVDVAQVEPAKIVATRLEPCLNKPRQSMRIVSKSMRIGFYL
jgi:hypothetical protein